ncbi:MAG: PAS domain S-box protein [Sulfuricurvum sp.]|nr:PAS domain S-box protein [Sulfuricurvum sp.]MDP3023558.1 PAS domain S-box protein [Sulfuricurvum sp.]
MDKDLIHTFLSIGELLLFFILIAMILMLRRQKFLLMKQNKEIMREYNNTQNYFDIAAAMILVLDKNHNVIRINKRGCEIMGYRADEIIGKNWIENFLPVRCRKKAIDVSNEIKRKRNHYNEFTNPILTKEGKEKVIFWKNASLKDENDLPIGIVTSGEDITERINSERVIQESELFYRTIFSTVHDAIFILEDNCIIDCNLTALRLLKMNREEIIGRHIKNSILKFECPVHPFDNYLTAASAGTSSTLRCSLILTGDIIENKVTDVTISSLGSRQKNRLLLSVHDITEHLDQKSKLLRNMRQAQMGEMISNIAHQWRQPLTIVNSIVSQIGLQENIKEEPNKLLIEKTKEIEKQIQYLSQTITDFRDFFHPNKSKERIIVSRIIDKALSLIDHAIESHGVTIEYRIEHDSEVFLFQNEVLQVILVLLKNSLDAFAENEIEGAQITIKIDQIDEYAIITMKDNAGGIDKNIIKNIFLPYYTTKIQSAGTGIGLSLSKTIIEDHCNGFIDVQSENHCTIFTIKLPLEENQP